MNDTSILDT